MFYVALVIFALLVIGSIAIHYKIAKDNAEREKNRCPELAPKEKKTGLVFRCELENGHSGPHKITIPDYFNNGGLPYWWNSDS